MSSAVSAFFARSFASSAGGHTVAASLTNSSCSASQTANSVHAWLQEFSSGSSIGLVELNRSVFGGPVRQDILARALRYEQIWRLQGTESTKSLSQVRATKKKPFAQKGRGKARQGTLVGPHFAGGYNAHGPRPHLKSTDIQQKVYDFAIRSALSAKFSQDQLILVDKLTLSNDSKEALLDRLKALKLEGRSCLMLYGSHEPEVELTRSAEKFMIKRKSEDLPFGERFVMVTPATMIAVEPVLNSEYLVVDKAAVEVLEEMYNVS